METKITYLGINSETSECLASGREFDNHADAYVAALTDGEGALERDAEGYMRVVENGKQIYTGGGFNPDDRAAKEDVVRQVARNLNVSEYRFTTLKVERDAEGKIIKIDDSGDAELIAYWNRRIA